MNTLQSLVLPNFEVPAPQDLHVRLNTLAWAELPVSHVRFTQGGELTSDTFYGGFSVGPWKRHCDIRSLWLGLEGAGDFAAALGLYRPGRPTVWLSERCVSLLPGQQARLPVEGWNHIEDGMLFFKLRALDRGVLTGAAYLTADEAPNDVRLGLVITHFDQQARVIPAVERIRRSVVEHPHVQGRITLTVVDNSRDLAVEGTDGVKKIPNRNLGSAGGFARGLLDLMDSGEHTHALFMDDDASCETESVLRTFAMLRYARDPKLAVAGALLDESAPWRLMEKGARFDGMRRPLHAGLDMRRVEDLLLADAGAARPDHGGWWFLAFKLNQVRHFPFPFFSRGDDVFFSLTNGFHITTLNGVACLGEDSVLKHGPMTAYLDARYHLLHALLDEANGAHRIAELAWHLCMRPLLSYNYANARAFTLAMHHLLQGPGFFKSNMDLLAVRSQISAWTPSHKMLPIDQSSFLLDMPRSEPESRWRLLLRWLTLHGLLMPQPPNNQPVLLQEKGFHGDPGAVFGYRRVLYEHTASSTGYVADHDRGLFLHELGVFVATAAKLRARLRKLREAHQAGFDEMATAEFWREVHGNPTQPPSLERLRLIKPKASTAAGLVRKATMP
jgi:hypothetical protein